MPWSVEIVNALRANSLNGLMVNVDSGYMLKVHEVAPHVLLSKELWLGHVYLLVMNRDTWNALAPADRDAIQRAAERAYRTLGQVMDSSFDEQVATLKQHGATVRILKAAEVHDWQTATRHQKVQADWAKKQEEQGGKMVAAVLAKVSAILRESMPPAPHAAE
ncbi:MAG: transporter substrate-binding protein [Burkholderiaceae bacterium]|nr:transporter substrate-binding protein [Burkholderiaceae bacterium]